MHVIVVNFDWFCGESKKAKIENGRGELRSRAISLGGDTSAET